MTVYWTLRQPRPLSCLCFPDAADRIQLVAPFSRSLSEGATELANDDAFRSLAVGAPKRTAWSEPDALPLSARAYMADQRPSNGPMGVSQQQRVGGQRSKRTFCLTRPRPVTSLHMLRDDTHRLVRASSPQQPVSDNDVSASETKPRKGLVVTPSVGGGGWTYRRAPTDGLR